MRKPKATIALIGMTGSGKTTLGQRLATECHRPFVDLDQWIQTQSGQTIPELFARIGEEGFRRLETEALQEAVLQEGCIISCGGGVVLKKENRDLLEGCVVVFLKRPLSDIAATIDVGNRPLLSQDPSKLERLYQERLAWYEDCADFTIGGHGNLDASLEELKKIASFDSMSQRLAVIGSPIGHSMSPTIHHAVLDSFLFNVDYEKVEIKEKDLAVWLESKQANGYHGFNVTMPLKRAIIPLLSRLEDEAAQFESVNTVVLRSGHYVGYNTDGTGFSQALSERDFDFGQRTVGLIGAGGAGATIAQKAIQSGASEVTLYVRNPKQGTELSTILEREGKAKCTIYSLSELLEGKGLNALDILIQATPLGMEGVPAGFDSFAFFRHLQQDALVTDLIYRPIRTAFLREAELRGFKTVGGLSMLIYQGILADRLYLDANLALKKSYRRVMRMLDDATADSVPAIG